MKMGSLVLFSLFFLVGCGMKMGDSKLDIKPELVLNKYDTLKAIVIEEANNNGFSQLTSEIKPSKYNEQRGRLFFSLKTPFGTDQLIVDFDNGNISMSGAGLRSNPESAIKAITFRIKELNESNGAKSTPAAIPKKISVDTTSSNSQQEATTKLKIKSDTKASSPAPISTFSTTSMVVTGNKAKIRKKPSAKAAVVKTIKKGEVVQVIKQSDDWFQIELASGDVGWCHKSVLERQN